MRIRRAIRFFTVVSDTLSWQAISLLL